VDPENLKKVIQWYKETRPHNDVHAAEIRAAKKQHDIDDEAVCISLSKRFRLGIFRTQERNVGQ